VLVPGTAWIVSSGMADGAGFYLVDSSAGSATVLPFVAQHDPRLPVARRRPRRSRCKRTALNIRASGAGRAKLYVVGHGAREAIEIFDVDRDGAHGRR
jgi:hypothetical protein